VNGIDNVVFVAADLHGTLVNDLFYQLEPSGEQFPVNAFEIVTGPIAYDPPFGPSLIAQAVSSGVIDEELQAFYESLSMPLKDLLVQLGIDVGLAFTVTMDWDSRDRPYPRRSSPGATSRATSTDGRSSMSTPRPRGSR
jgi:hypothetical protein